MNIRQKLIVGIGLTLVCGAILRSAFSKSATANGSVDPPTAAAATENPWTPPAVSGSTAPVEVAKTETHITHLKPFYARETDGKEALPPDGKEALPPDGKEALPPVGESVGLKAQVVDISAPGAPPEYLGTPGERLLSPPSPVNVSGPVVSAETRPPVVVPELR